jgi:MarR family transcriptional regulator, negative regulator of the multidrug operon emrRAB
VAHTNPRDANLLGTLSLAVAGRMETAIASQLGPSAPAALCALEGYLGGEPIEVLRQVLALTHSGAVRLVDRLVDAGLAEREPGPDARTVAVALTPAGRVAAEGIREARTAALEEVLEVLSADERDTLTALHERLLAGLTSDRASARRLCRLCDIDACGHHRGTCPVTNARAAASPAA